MEASAYASDALARCRPAVWVGEGETQAQTRQRRGFSRDESLERVRAEPAGALMGVSTCMLGVYWGNAAWLRGPGRAKHGPGRGSEGDSQGTSPLSGCGQSPPWPCGSGCLSVGRVGKCRPTVWAGEGEPRAQTRQPRGFSRDKSLERERAEPDGVLLEAGA